MEQGALCALDGDDSDASDESDDVIPLPFVLDAAQARCESPPPSRALPEL